MRGATKDRGEVSTPAAILFDLDGTLYDMRLLAPLLGLASFHDFGRLAAFFAARESKAGIDFGSRDALLDALALDASLRLSGEDPENLRRWYDECLYGRFVAVLRTFFRARPCVRRFLSDREGSGKGGGPDRGHRPLIGVLSDYGHVDDRIHAIGLDPLRFDLRLSNEDEGALKPAARPYLRAAELFGVAYEKVLVVGDRDDADGAGAAAAGMAFFRVTTNDEARSFFRGLLMEN